MYNVGMDNARRTHENAVKRMNQWTLSDKFKTATMPELETNLSFMDKSFTSFTEEHQKLVVTLRDPEKYKLEDEFYSNVHEVYRLAVIRFRSQMDHVVRERALRSMARRTRESAHEKVNQPIRQLTEQQQQQRQYEREQRRQRIVQLNDAAIHEVRTRDWINSLPAGTEVDEIMNRSPVDLEEAEMERKRHQINKQLAELDREIEERKKRLPATHSRERSRSPAVQFNVSIPLTNQIAQGERQRPSLPTVSANIHRQMERVNAHYRSTSRAQDGVSTSQNFNQVRSVVVSPQQVDLRNRIGSMPQRSCHFCLENHKMYQCPRFNQLKRAEREQHVEALKLCKNCFMPLEDGRHRCRFGRCENCGIGKFHNSLLCPVRHPDNVEYD